MAVKLKILLVLVLTSQVFGAFGDFELHEDGAKLIFNNNSQTVSLSASPSMSESVNYILPVADGDSSQTLITNGFGVWSWVDIDAVAGIHKLLTVTHTDVVNADVTRGSIIYGNSTPKWDELVISSALGGTATHFLGGDNTDVGYRTTSQVLSDLSGQATGAFDWNSQNLTGIGNIAGDDIDISAGTGDFSTTGNIRTTGGTLFGAQIFLTNFVSLYDSGTGFSTFLRIEALDNAYSADRLLSIDLGNRARSLTFSGGAGDDNVTIGNWFDQDVRIDSTPLFSGIGIASDTDLLRLAVGALTVNGTISATEIFNGAGDLKIQPDVDGDAVFFGDTDVADNVNGGKFIVHRRAVEGDDTLTFYINHARSAVFDSTSDMLFSTTVSGKDIFFRGAGNGAIHLNDQGSGTVKIGGGGGIVQIALGGGDTRIVGNCYIGGDVAPAVALEVQGISRFGDGGTTDYAAFASDGELTLAGTARVKKHLHFTMELGKGQSAPAERFDEDPYVTYTYALATNDDSHLSREAPDDMDYTEDSIIKIHWYTTDASANSDGDEVRWEVQWASRAPGEDITAGDTTDNSGDIVCLVANIIVETSVETIPANSIAAGDMIGIHLQRVALGDGASPQAGTVHVIDVELEYTSDKLGEAI